jgi:hypothetical protein
MLTTMKSFFIGTLWFSSLLLPIQATGKTLLRGVHRELVETAVELGTAGNYTILAKTAISTVPTSVITGDIAVSPISGAAMTGFSFTVDSCGQFYTSTQVTGKAYAANFIAPTPSLLTTAVSDMETAYTDAASRTNADAARINLGAGTLGGVFGGASHPLTPGVYTWDTDVHIAGDITFDGDENGVFIIQTTGNVVQDANVKVILTGGALAKNIFWQVAGLVEVGAGAHLEGTLLVMTGVTFFTASSLDGRVLAQTAVTLQKATITEM